MSHSTEIVAWQKVSNGQHSICIRCCGDQGTDHWHTMNVITADGQPVDKVQRDQTIEAMRQFVANQHEQMQQHTQDMLDKAGDVVAHP